MSKSEEDSNGAFGLSFTEHDNRQMQYILRAYDKLPENPTVRSAVYLNLLFLEKSLKGQPDIDNIKMWMKNGGVIKDFPTPSFVLLQQEEDRRKAETEEAIQIAEAEASGSQGLDTDALQGQHTSSTGWKGSGWWGEGRNLAQPDPAWMEEDVVHMSEPLNSSDENPFSHHRPEPNEDILHHDQEDSDQDDDDRDNSDHHPHNHHDESISQHIDISGEEQKECGVCMETYSIRYFPPSAKITSTCDHVDDSIACLHCIQESIRAAIKDGALHRIVCPFCPAKLSRGEIATFAGKEVFSRYDYLVMMSTPGLVMCLGPNCGKGQVHAGELLDQQPFMTCNSCGFKTCVGHKLPWHEGFTCEEYDMDDSQIERLEADEATAKLLAQNSRVCPTCKQGVTKQDGCDHLHCRCGEEWCFVCLASWENVIRIGPTAHARTCSYHPDKVNQTANQKAANANRMTELVHGGPVSETLEKARVQRNATRRAALRPLAAEAAERRMKAMAEEKKNIAEASGSASAAKKRKTKLVAAWEER